MTTMKVTTTMKMTTTTKMTMNMTTTTKMMTTTTKVTRLVDECLRGWGRMEERRDSANDVLVKSEK